MHITRHMLTSLLAIGVLFSTVPAQAQDARLLKVAVPLEENAEQRINLSGKLRMLSQRIASAACHLTQGVDADASANLLTASAAEFEQILTALQHGDPALNIIRPETRRKTLVRIDELRTLWAPYQAASAAIGAGQDTAKHIAFILDENLAVLRAAQNLVSELVKQYSNPNKVTYADLLVIDVAGRQRMLTQKMAKEACALRIFEAAPKIQASLDGTMQVFEASLHALRNGMQDVGIKAPPNADIATALDVVLDDWTSVKPMLTRVVAGGRLDDVEKASTFSGLNITMANMNKTVGMYVASTKPVWSRKRQ